MKNGKNPMNSLSWDFLCFFHRVLNILTPRISATTKKTTKTKKIIFAIDAAPAAMSVNPKIEAINAMTKKIKDHLSIIHKFR